MYAIAATYNEKTAMELETTLRPHASTNDPLPPLDKSITRSLSQRPQTSLNQLYRGSLPISAEGWAIRLAGDKAWTRKIEQRMIQQAPEDLAALRLLIALSKAVDIAFLYTEYLQEDAISCTFAPQGVYCLMKKPSFIQEVAAIEIWMQNQEKAFNLDPLTGCVVGYLKEKKYLEKADPLVFPPEKWHLLSPTLPSALANVFSNSTLFPKKPSPTTCSIESLISQLCALYCPLKGIKPQDVNLYIELKQKQILANLPLHLPLISQMLDRLYTAREWVETLPKEDQNKASGKLSEDLEHWISRLPKAEQWSLLKKETGTIPDKIIGSNLLNAWKQLAKKWDEHALTLQIKGMLQILNQRLEWEVDSQEKREKMEAKTAEELTRSIVADRRPNFLTMVIDNDILENEDTASSIGIALKITEKLIASLYPNEDLLLDTGKMKHILKEPVKDQWGVIRQIFAAFEFGMHAEHDMQFRKTYPFLYTAPLRPGRDKTLNTSTSIYTISNHQDKKTIEVSVDQEFFIYWEGEKPVASYRRATYFELDLEGNPLKAGFRITNFQWKEATPEEQKKVLAAF